VKRGSVHGVQTSLLAQDEMNKFGLLSLVGDERTLNSIHPTPSSSSSLPPPAPPPAFQPRPQLNQNFSSERKFNKPPRPFTKRKRSSVT